MPRQFFDQYYDLIARRGEAAALLPEVVLGNSRSHSLIYVPFEHVNSAAKICFVGITPGPNQISDSYAAVRNLALRDEPRQDIPERVKRYAAFGGPAMRPNLLRLINGTGLSDLLEISDASQLWGDASHLIHSTSVVPHAAFNANSKPFNGSFEEVMRSPLLRESFELDFVASLPALSDECLFVALGPTPLDALRWCVERGHIAEDRLLGAFPHPSSNGGSQTDLYLGTKSIEDLKDRDPVRLRGYLIDWASELRQKIETLRSANPRP
ncbi:hypothetical protein [Bosea sp. RAC05]|uniref:hypothetical protein n=1 Tax=Bosea sp. RAC05 TaxID=1842539 RepID=UPI00083D9FF2|nr:hypothetical protein [Bosea sp. RAC05]AOG03376.1 hypothetical protein BSY19_4848 [Bosea sp. RAC05]